MAIQNEPKAPGEEYQLGHSIHHQKENQPEEVEVSQASAPPFLPSEEDKVTGKTWAVVTVSKKFQY